MTALATPQREALAENLAAVRERVAAAARRSGRSAEAVTLVAVSKTKPLAAVVAAWEAGQRDFGENRVQEALGKIADAPPGLVWHMIGHLQANKARLVPGRFAMVHSVDSARLAHALQKAMERHADPGRTLDVLIQLNWTGETTKSGVADEAGLRDLVAEVGACPALRLRGLMTMPDPALGEAETRRHFAQVARLRERLQADLGLGPAFDALSMGMTHDFEWAIEEGATIVRVGTAIFGARP